jgi:hypothetical protein
MGMLPAFLTGSDASSEEDNGLSGEDRDTLTCYKFAVLGTQASRQNYGTCGRDARVPAKRPVITGYSEITEILQKFLIFS